MPLAFRSLSHGTVAFGFFNIHTDMLLLGELFFFASDFSRAVAALCTRPRAELEGYRIREPSRIGDLGAAIAGQDLSGFIGATYRLWPFPADPEGFRQQPEGHENRDEVEELVRGFGTGERLALERGTGSSTFHVGEYRFDARGFASLVAYVERGGYPRWRDGTRPGYVIDMIEALEVSSLLP